MIRPLRLPGEGPVAAPTLPAVLAEQAAGNAEREALARLVATLAETAAPIAARLALGALPGDPNAVVGTNETGDRQKALDLAAHEHVVAALRGASVRAVLSEEAEEEVPLDPGGRFDLAIDPIDGSGSIGIGAPLGMLFCVFPAGGFLRPGREIVAAGYVSFGHSVDLGASLGDGVVMATLDPASGRFHVETPRIEIPAKTSMIAFNASNLRRWRPGLARYVQEAMSGAEGPRGRDFNMRWIAAAVGDLHRILRQGGVFLLPADPRGRYARGRLRLLYEAFPIAWLMEQAGGAAIDETGRAILDRAPAALHEHTPLIFGSRDEVAEIARHLAAS